MLYKYRSLTNWKLVLDILIHSRLYAASFLDLNDPMEGYYSYATDRTVSGHFDEKIRREKAKLRICSLTAQPYSTLMWSYYAGGHAGIVIGVDEIANRSSRRTEVVRYDNYVTLGETPTRTARETAIEILSQKLWSWRHEAEHRVFSRGCFVPVTIRLLLLGCNISKEDEGLLRRLVEGLRSGVEVRKVRASELVADYAS